MGYIIKNDQTKRKIELKSFGTVVGGGGDSGPKLCYTAEIEKLNSDTGSSSDIIVNQTVSTIQQNGEVQELGGLH